MGTPIFRAQAYDLDEQPVLRFAIDKSASYAKNEDGIVVSITEYDYISAWDLNTVDGTLKVVK